MALPDRPKHPMWTVSSLVSLSRSFSAREVGHIPWRCHSCCLMGRDLGAWDTLGTHRATITVEGYL